MAKGTTKIVYILMMQTADHDFAELYKVIKDNYVHRSGRRILVR